MKIKVKTDSIPLFYHNSELYDELIQTNKKEISISLSLYKVIPVIDNFKDFKNIMKIIHYWKCKSLSNEIYTYIIQNIEEIRGMYHELSSFTIGKEDIHFLCFELNNINKLCFYSSNKGLLPLLKYAMTNSYEYNEQTCSIASQSGHLSCLIYLHENGCPWNEWACIRAAECGHLDCLQYAVEKGCPLSDYVCSYAAENGHLHIIQYAYSIGCPWTPSTIFNASLYGYLEMLQWCHIQGCPIDERACLYASEGNQYKCLKYGLENNFPIHYEECMNIAVKNKSTECIELLRTFKKNDIEYITKKIHKININKNKILST